MNNKRKIHKHVRDMLKESHKKALLSLDRVLNSGCIDMERWDEENAPMILPKTILTAILEDEANQYTARGTKYEKQMKKEVRNIRMFI